MKQSMRTRLVFISAGMILLSIVICWIMNLFLLPGFYENSKKKQMNSVYSQVAELFAQNDWANISSDKQNEVYDEVDRISANSGVSLYIMEIKVNVDSGMVSDISYL